LYNFLAIVNANTLFGGTQWYTLKLLIVLNKWWYT